MSGPRVRGDGSKPGLRVLVGVRGERSWLCPHHAGAIAVVAVLDLSPRLAALPVTAGAVVLQVHRQVHAGSLSRLAEGQLHHELEGGGEGRWR